MRYGRFAILVAFLLISGCVSYSANRYSVSIDHVSTLQELNDTRINVGEFTATKPGLTNIMCRGLGPVTTPGNLAFEKFIKSSLQDELIAAEVFSESAPITLSGNLESINFSSTSGYWDIAVTIKSSNGRSIFVQEHYLFKATFVGETACRNSAKALSPAIQSMISKLFNHPDFKSLLN